MPCAIPWLQVTYHTCPLVTRGIFNFGSRIYALYMTPLSLNPYRGPETLGGYHIHEGKEVMWSFIRWIRIPAISNSAILWNPDHVAMNPTGNTLGQDLNLSLDRVLASRNFTNKLWNAGKFIDFNLTEVCGILKPYRFLI